jgi:plasmid stability protein
MESDRAKREQITVPVDAELRARLEAAAAREHRTVAGYARAVLARAVEQEWPA